MRRSVRGGWSWDARTQRTADRVAIGRPPYLITADPRVGRLHSSVLDSQRLWIVPIDTLPSVESILDLRGGWIAHDLIETVPRYAVA